MEAEQHSEQAPIMDHSEQAPNMDHSEMDGTEMDIPIPEDELVDPHLHEGDFRCPYCGMKSELSHAQVVVEWTVGGHNHFDSWDCAFGHRSDESLKMSRVRVLEHGSTPDAPVWLDAAEAWFLYDTKKITMSMPPYVAAFDTRAAAEAALPDWGGEVLDFAGLQALWE